MVIFGVAVLLLGVLGILSVKGISDNKEMLSRPYTDALRGAAVIVVLLHHAETGLYKELPAVFTVFVPLGALGTAVFFYLSGYGNHYSLENNKGGHWLIQKAGRLVASYIIMMLIYSAILWAAKDVLVAKENLVQYGMAVFTLTIPPFTSWYIKIQLLAYVMHFLSRKLAKGLKASVVLAVLLAVYTISMRVAGFDDFWWTSAICYGMGDFAAEKKEILQKYLSKIWVSGAVSILAVAGYICSWKLHHGTLFMCAAGVAAFTGISLRLRVGSCILARIGSVSYELYLSQVAAMYLILTKQNVDVNIKVSVYILTAFAGAFIIKYLSGCLLPGDKRHSSS